MSKKFLALALALLMIVGCFTVAASATQFSDDKAIKDYRTEITVLGALGLFQGYQGTGEFGADKPILRREACILFARILTGETSAEYAQANFMGTENYTPFTDLDAEGDFYGAISLAANEGLIIGWTDAESNQLVFNPNGNISYQDFLVMAVRLLNYGEKTIIKELDATYPWSYINKAIQTGLTRGVKGVQTNEEPITRGVAAKIIYNLLFSCVWPNCGSDLFFIRNLFAKKNVSFDTYYVTGKSQKDYKDNSNYYLLKSLTGKCDDVLVSENVIEFPAGMTVTDMYKTAYEVVCLNGEAIATNALPYAIFHENDISLDKENVVINGVKYALASAYNFPTEAVEQKHIWVKDDSLPTIFIQNFADWSVITNNAAMKVDGKDPLYETMVAFDDNNDGIYDRAAYAYETLWSYTAPDGKGNIGGILTGVKNRVSAANGDIVRGFSVGAIDGVFSKYLVINGKYAPQTAKVMKYDFTSGKVWLADSSANTNMWWDVEGEGTAYSLGLDGLKGIDLGTTYVDTIVESLLQNIVFYAEGNQIFKVNTKSTGYFIFDEFVSYDFSGYINMRVMDPATGKYTIIKVTTVDNYPYYSFAGTAFGDKWNTYGNDVTDIFDFGDVVAYVTDGTGTYNVFDMETALDNGKAPALKTDGISIVNNDKNTVKRIIAMDDQLGLVSIDLAKSDAAATVTIASGVEYVALGNTLYVFDYENGCIDASGIVDAKVAQNGTNGGIYDVVYYDGSLMSNVKIDAIKDGGALVGYSTVWTYTDVAGVKGFASFTANNEKNLVVNSYNRITKPGFYTLIQMNDGSVWFGDAIFPYVTSDLTGSECAHLVLMEGADVDAVLDGNAYTFDGNTLVPFVAPDGDIDSIDAIYYNDHVVLGRNTLQTIDADLSMLATDKDGKPVLNDAKLYIVLDADSSKVTSTVIGERFEKKTGYDQHAAVSYTDLIDDFTDGANTSDPAAQALILFFANQTTADELYANGELVDSVETTALIDLSKISAKLYAASSANGLGDFIADCTLTEVATYDDDNTDGRYVVKVEANAIAGNGIYTIENGKLTQIATGLNKSTPIILSYNTKYFNTVAGYEYCLDDALEADTNGAWNYGVIRVTYGDLSVDYNVLFSLGETVVG